MSSSDAEEEIVKGYVVALMVCAEAVETQRATSAERNAPARPGRSARALRGVGSRPAMSQGAAVRLCFNFTSRPPNYAREPLGNATRDAPRAVSDRAGGCATGVPRTARPAPREIRRLGRKRLPRVSARERHSPGPARAGPAIH